ncbi:hypothetical protein BJ085DRAFT_15087 [Dimargaris cristalligena]|uniref:DNA replication complex GINS protein SLD5 n=1 Tax=Dimargaris cristalligena TaxID=215637 RepID=A0A4Q0A0C6_9FUNG|nr:hypothetical protein BJ085DRAFT_15087 [Dimargaris cristalligena]|eukprot:RKP39485.1 hypothetical protein BJ085DRAFT_15087 [Dimargaris cristalligena]
MDEDYGDVTPITHDAHPGADAEPNIDELLQGALGTYGQIETTEFDGNFTNEDVKKLTRTWLNEKQAPDLLPYQDQLVGDLTEMVQNQLQLVDALQEESAGQAFIAMLYQSELERIKFVIRSYLKVRLQKIERYIMLYASSEDHLARMSLGERAFAVRYKSLFENHLHKTCLDKLPESLRSLDENNGNISMVTVPNLRSAVVCRVLTNVGDYAITETETVDMRKDNIFLVSYDSIQNLLDSHSIELI